MKTLKIALFASLVNLWGCGEDISQQTAAWTTGLAEVSARVDGLRTQASSLSSALQSLPDFASIPSLAAERAALAGKLAAVTTALGAIPGVIAEQTTAVTQAFTQKKIAVATDATATAMSTINQSVTTASTGLTQATSSLGALQAAAPIVAQVTEFRTRFAASQAMTTASAAGTIDFLDVDFEPGTANFELTHPNTQPALDRMVAIMKSCPTIQAHVLGHTSREGAAALNMTLSQQRADAVSAYLTAHGVNRRAITGTTGKGDAMLAVPEPAADSPEAAAMNPELLESMRVVNRRVSLNVTQACPAS